MGIASSRMFVAFCDDLYLPAVIDHKMFHVLGQECLWKHQANFSLLLEDDFHQNTEHCIMNHPG